MNFDLLPGWIVSTDYPIKLHLDHIFSCVHVMTYTSNYISLKLHSKYIWLKKPCPLNLIFLRKPDPFHYDVNHLDATM